MRYATARADKEGKGQVDGRHFLDRPLSLAGRDLIVGLGAVTEIDVHTADGGGVCSHERAYEVGALDSSNPASQIPLLYQKVGGWEEQALCVRAALPVDSRLWNAFRKSS